MIPGIATVSGKEIAKIGAPQDTVRRVVIKMTAREIPEVSAVDYNKLFKEASPLEAKASKKSVYRKHGVQASVRKKAVTPAFIAKKKTAAPKPVLIAAAKPKPSKISVSRPVEKTKVAVVKAAPASPISTKPVEKAKLAVLKPAPAKLIQKKRVEKAALAVAKPAVKPAAKAEPAPATAESFGEEAPTVYTNNSAKTLSAEEIIAEKGPTDTKSGTGSADYKTAAEIVASGMPVVVKNPSYSQYYQSINAEQEKWKDSNENSFTQEQNNSSMNYLYGGIAITVLGIVLGLIFRRSAFMVSAAGLVLVVIGLFIRL